MIKCPGCSKELDDGAKFCTGCGRAIKPAIHPQQQEKPTAQPQNDAQPVKPQDKQSQSKPHSELPPSFVSQPAPQHRPIRTESVPQQDAPVSGSQYSSQQGQYQQNNAGCQTPPPYCGQNQTPPPYYGQPMQYSQYGAYGTPVNAQNSEPLGTLQYLLMMVVAMIPIVGLIFMIIWAIGGSSANINRRNYARAYLIVQIASIVLCILLIFIVIVLAPVIFGLLEGLSYALI